MRAAAMIDYGSKDEAGDSISRPPWRTLFERKTLQKILSKPQQIEDVNDSILV